MSKYHYWLFLVDSAGQPIEKADIGVFKANTNQPAYIYKNALGGEATNNAPQLETNELGYFEFWVGDENEERGYSATQKFKISWEKVGISSGYIDYVEIFPFIKPVNENNKEGLTKNKALSDALAYKWDTHVESEDPSVHGMQPINLNDPDKSVKRNKLLSNYLGIIWQDHVDQKIDSAYFESNPPSTFPHNLQPINPNDTNETKNKLINNNIIKNINDEITELQNRVFVWTTTINSGDWSTTGGEYYREIQHNLGVQYPVTQFYNLDDNLQIYPNNVKYLNENKIRISFKNDLNIFVKIINL